MEQRSAHHGVRQISLVEQRVLNFSGFVQQNAIAFGNVDNNEQGDIGLVVGNTEGTIGVFQGLAHSYPIWTCKGLGTVTAILVGDVQGERQNSILVICAEGDLFLLVIHSVALIENQVNVAADEAGETDPEPIPCSPYLVSQVPLDCSCAVLHFFGDCSFGQQLVLGTLDGTIAVLAFRDDQADSVDHSGTPFHLDESSPRFEQLGRWCAPGPVRTLSVCCAVDGALSILAGLDDGRLASIPLEPAPPPASPSAPPQQQQQQQRSPSSPPHPLAPLFLGARLTVHSVARLRSVSSDSELLRSPSLLATKRQLLDHDAAAAAAASSGGGGGIGPLLGNNGIGMGGGGGGDESSAYSPALICALRTPPPPPPSDGVDMHNPPLLSTAELDPATPAVAATTADTAPSSAPPSLLAHCALDGRLTLVEPPSAAPSPPASTIGSSGAASGGGVGVGVSTGVDGDSGRWMGHSASHENLSASKFPPSSLRRSLPSAGSLLNRGSQGRASRPTPPPPLALWCLPLQDFMFAAQAADVNGDGQDEIILCGWSGMTHIVDMQQNVVRFHFPSRACAFRAGRLTVSPGDVQTCFIYSTLDGQIIGYPGVARAVADVPARSMFDVLQARNVLHKCHEVAALALYDSSQHSATAAAPPSASAAATAQLIRSLLYSFPQPAAVGTAASGASHTTTSAGAPSTSQPDDDPPSSSSACDGGGAIEQQQLAGAKAYRDNLRMKVALLRQRRRASGR